MQVLITIVIMWDARLAQPVLCFDCYDIKFSAADIRVGYEMTVYNTTEGDTFVELCAIIYEPISGVAPRPFVISYATSDDTAGNYSKNVIIYCIGQDLPSAYSSLYSCSRRLYR